MLEEEDNNKVILFQSNDFQQFEVSSSLLFIAKGGELLKKMSRNGYTRVMILR